MLSLFKEIELIWTYLKWDQFSSKCFFHQQILFTIKLYNILHVWFIMLYSFMKKILDGVIINSAYVFETYKRRA